MAAVSSYPQQVETDEAQKAYVAMLDKLKTYQAYPVGWDGEDAVPLTPQVVMNFNHLLEVIDKQLLVGLTIFPETNGILLLYHQGWSGNGRERNRFFGTGHYTGHQEDCRMTELDDRGTGSSSRHLVHVS